MQVGKGNSKQDNQKTIKITNIIPKLNDLIICIDLYSKRKFLVNDDVVKYIKTHFTMKI